MIFSGWCLIIIGLFVVFSGIVGMFRFPNFYTKLHGAGVIDACGIPLCLVGLAFLQQNTVNSLKLVVATIFILLLNPVATHALARASLNQNNEEQTKVTLKNEKSGA